MTKKIVSMLLILSMMLPALACSSSTDNKPNSSETTAATVETTKPSIVYEEDDLPDNLNFEGEEIIFLTPAGKEGTSHWDGEITVEELVSEAVNDSVYNREKFVEDRLGVEIESVGVAQGDYNQKVLAQMTADENTYQIYAASTVWFASNAFHGYLYDLYDLDYLNLEKPWWSQNFTEAAEFKDHLYMATGSLSLSLTRFLFAIYYNKELAEDYSTEIPDLSNLYEIVDQGKWTYDKFYELGSGIYQDMNGNSERDDEDVYGIALNNGIATDTIWSGFDLKIFSKDESGWFYLDINQEKLYSCLDKMIQLLFNTNGAYVPANHEDGALQEISTKFASDSIVFMINKLHEAESETLRNMQSDYGILPYPKYDANQKEYYSYAHDQYLSFSVPTTNPNPDVAAAVLEAMASYSYRETSPAYLNLALKGKYMSDAYSRRMIDLVVNGFKLDSNWIYCQELGGVGGAFRELLRSGSTSYATTYTKIEKNTNTILKIMGREVE